MQRARGCGCRHRRASVTCGRNGRVSSSNPAATSESLSVECSVSSAGGHGRGDPCDAGRAPGAQRVEFQGESGMREAVADRLQRRQRVTATSPRKASVRWAWSGETARPRELRATSRPSVTSCTRIASSGVSAKNTRIVVGALAAGGGRTAARRPVIDLIRPQSGPEVRSGLRMAENAISVCKPSKSKRRAAARRCAALQPDRPG